MTPRETLPTIRALLAALWMSAAFGIAAELLLLEHTEDTWQIVPLAVLGAGAAGLTWALVSKRAAAIRTFQGLMLVTLGSAIAGLWLHYVANTEFARELNPDLAGWALLWKSIHGTSPPSLAPGAMAVVALVGLVWSYRHPTLHTETIINDQTGGEPRS